MADGASRSRSNKKGWWRDLFLDIPDSLASGTDQFYGSLKSNKTKVYCQRCFEHHITEALQNDERRYLSGALNEKRSRAAIERELWTGNSRHIRSSAVQTLLNHLKDCDLQTHEIREKARQKRLLDSSGNSPSRHHAPLLHVHVPHLSSMTGTSSTPLDFHSFPQQPDELQSSPFSSTFVTPDAGPSRSSPLSYPGTPLSSTPPLPYPSLHRFPSTESLRPSDSLSMANDTFLSQRALSSSARGKQRAPSRGSPVSSEFLPWTDLKKKHFEKSVVRLTASANMALSWVENAEWISICDEFMPGAPIISRKVLTKRILRDTVAEIRNEIKKEVKGKDVTLQGDGWTGQNHHHLIAFMVAAVKKVHTVRVHDASTERKTAENLLRVLEEVLLTVEKDWEATVVAVVTDASGESRKARRLFARKYPQIIQLDCYAHQINLVVGDFFKSNSDLLQYTELATELITWLRSKTLILAHLPLAVIRAILTRWTAHYTAYRRLLMLQSSLKSLAYGDDDKSENEKVMVTGDAKAKAKARSMLTIIHNSLFWHNLTLITRYLEPLAIAANIVQASFCRLDEVLVTFGFLVMQYQAPGMDQDLVGRNAILKSIELRWHKSEQELFIAAVIANPFYRNRPFARLPIFNNAGIRVLFVRLWKRLYLGTPPPEFEIQLQDFLNGSGIFSNLESQCSFELEAAEAKQRRPDPLNVYEAFCFAGQPRPPFIALAHRLLSVSANSASCERLFSIFGNTLTKLRTRLKVQTLTELSELKMHVRDEHIRTADTKQRLKRRFGSKTTNVNAIPLRNVSQSLPATSVDTITTHSNQLINESDTDTPHASATFRTFVEQQIDLVDEDNEDNESFSTDRPIKLTELFDFENGHWSDLYARIAKPSYEEELALYELLELDADGENDIELDDSTQDILGS